MTDSHADLSRQLAVLLVDRKTGECEIGGVRCKVVPEELAPRSRNPYIPEVGHDPACNLLIACNCAMRRQMTQKEFDYCMNPAAAIDLSSLPVVPEREILHLYDRSHAAYARGYNAALDAIGVKND